MHVKNKGEKFSAPRTLVVDVLSKISWRCNDIGDELKGESSMLIQVLNKAIRKTDGIS